MINMEEYILITGASSGIGRQIAIRISEHSNVIINGRNSERLLETKSKCSNGKKVIIWEFDLNSTDDIEKSLSTFIKDNQIKINKFIHCAGYMKMLPLKMISIKEIYTTFSVNLFAAIMVLKVLNSKKWNKSALNSVVLISSNISGFGAKAFSLYGASKASLDGLMKNLAIELAPKVRINSVLPGAIKTEMTESIFENEVLLNRMKDTYPLGLGDVDDIYEMVDFLLSDKAKWITGQQFVVDGGRTVDLSG